DWNRSAKDTMDGTRHELTTGPRTNTMSEPGRSWQIASQLSEARLAANRQAERNQWIFQQVESAYIAIAILGSIAFLYLSTIPWVFASPDFESRLAGVWASLHWDAAQPLDPIANVLAFIPLGLAWSAAWSESSPKRRWRPIETLKAATGCLVLAILAEVLQFWIPLRDPSIRDVLALECGAILGCGLWLAVGQWVTAALCRVVEWLTVATPRLFRLRGPLVLGSTFLACLMIVVYASPVRLFWAYRKWSISLQHLPVSRPDLSAPQPPSYLSEFWTSVGVFVLLVGACRIGQSSVRLFKARAFSR
ncbi:MAG TPA: VanZ family protein, partial [Planctomycetaceae bacterium]|nr:VanZ family protein [Planctomycetaceae bacterium]